MSDAEQQTDFKAKFTNITSTQSVDEQAMTFLRAFVGEFQVFRRLSSPVLTKQGKFEEVLQLADEFKTFCVKMKGHIQELDEFECHRWVSHFTALYTFPSNPYLRVA